jgi:hypothetical protein
MKLSKLSALSLVMVGGLSACAAEGEPGVDGLAETFPAPLPPPAEMLDWQSAALTPSLDAWSPFMRAQSLMSRLAHWAYRSDEDFEAAARPEGLSPVQYVHHQSGGLGVGNADAVFGYSDNRKVAFLAVRGSSTRGDYLTDLFSAPTLPSTLGGPSQATLHRGFLNYAETIFSELQTNLTEVCAPGPAQVPLWLTGHSLGGAVATILAERLVTMGCNVRGVVTLGSPRPGLTDFHDLYNNTALRDGSSLGSVTSRWVNGEDPIPCLAPGPAWSHVGRHHMVNAAGNLVLNADQDACETPDGMLGVLQTALHPLSVLDGSPEGRALHDWLTGLIVLRFVCDPNATWDDYVTFGACKAVEVGTRLIDTYGGLTPDRLIARGLDIAVNNADHDDSIYADKLLGDFSWNFVEGSTVTMRLPRFGASDPRPQIRDAITGDVCLADPEGDGRQWVCKFQVVPGAPAEYHFSVTQDDVAALVEPTCDRSWWAAFDDYVCVVDAGSERTLSFIQVI